MKSSLSQSGETLARDEVPSTLDAPSADRGTRPPVTFNTASDETTQSAQGIPHTLRDSMRASGDSGATERPNLAGELGDSFHPPPVTVPGGPETTADPGATGESPITHEEMGSGDIVDYDEPTGTGIELGDILESTNASAKTASVPPKDEDEIVIADDLAEDIAEDAIKPLHDREVNEETTDTAGAPLPPFRSGS